MEGGGGRWREREDVPRTERVAFDCKVRFPFTSKLPENILKGGKESC